MSPLVSALPSRSDLVPLEPMDPQLTSIQPGSGVIVKLELAWGGVRRWWLKTFRRGYVERMRACRRGEQNRCPHEVLDPRDLKYFQNQEGYWWDPSDDPFRWREQLPFARAGLCELVVFSVLCFGGAALLALALVSRQMTGGPGMIGWLLVTALLVIGGLIVWFFRDPTRRIPTDPAALVSPADGKIVTIEHIPHDDFVGGPAVLIGIFLSIFNVHVNRAPFAARVVGLTYKPGKYLNALKPESARENERLEVRLQSTQRPALRFRVRQISGAIARRIVCRVRPGDELAKGEQFGMIKLGSRTELVLPDVEGLEIRVKVGQSVQAGASVLARLSSE